MRVIGSIALRSRANGKIVCAENSGSEALIANRADIGLWETFDVIALSGFEELIVTPPPPIVTPAPVGSVALVRIVKDSLIANGIDLSGPCGALKITNAVAVMLKDQGAGLLYKPSGNNCNERATDIVCFKDGRAFDMLGDGGGANVPTWNQTDVDDVAGRWRAPVEP